MCVTLRVSNPALGATEGLNYFRKTPATASRYSNP